MSKIDLSGSLSFLSLAELLQVLCTNDNTGVITLTNEYVEFPGKIYLVNGNIHDAELASARGEEALMPLFGWLEGGFRYDRAPVSGERRIKKGYMEIIMDGLRLLDEGKIDVVAPVDFGKKGQRGADDESRVPEIRGPLVDYLAVVDEQSFRDGENIVLESKYGRWAWVILEGSAEVMKKTPRGDFPIVRLGKGAFIGTSAFILKDLYRTASTVARGDVHLGVLGVDSLATELSSFSRMFRKIVESDVKRLTRLTRTLANLYAGEATSFGIKKGRHLFKAGQEKLYEITEGTGLLYRQDQGVLVPLMPLEKGDVVGAIPFVKDSLEPGTAAVVISEDAVAAEIEMDSGTLQEEFDALSLTFRNILNNISISISVTAALICREVKKQKK